MEFDTVTVSLLERVPNAPTIDREESDVLQDAHMAYLASLHESGQLQAAGPFLGPGERVFRGLSLHRLPEEEVRALFEKDPLVRSGRLTVRLFTWVIPAGALQFARTRFPRSQAEI
jgi:hypothetical protein